MKKLKVLILTDHSNHSKENSLYALAKAMAIHEAVDQVDVASKGFLENDAFFKDLNADQLHLTQVDEGFCFSANASSLKVGLRREKISAYDLIWLRLPPPLGQSFLDHLSMKFPEQFIINNPKGIYETGSKAYLKNFEQVCAPMQICKSIDDIIHFKSQFPIVLKPFREYGGKGIVRIDGEKVWDGPLKTNFTAFIDHLKEQDIEYLGVKYLKNVSQGDKRIIVVNGKILGASLRLPADGSWLCNVSMGGTAHGTEVDEAEIEIVRQINPKLSKMGIVMYGVDTLMGDNGKRVLSEINTTSIGGLPQMAQQRKLPLVEEAIDLILQYYLKHRYVV